MASNLIQHPGRALPTTTVHATCAFNEIPMMTDPLGRYWDQPADIREALMDGVHVWLTPGQIKQLSTYDSSYPSGCYNGKCWLRHGEGDVRWLCWYHPHPMPGKIGIDHREILVIGDHHAP